MSYRLSSNEFDDPEKPALLKRLATYFAGKRIPFFVVGAMARDMVLGLGRRQRRKTNDLDISIMIQNWNTYEAVSADLGADPDFTKSRKQKQRWYFKGKVILDIIPFGEIAKADNHIYWPPDETPAMCVWGFPSMATAALELILDEEVPIAVASIPGLFVLKLLAWKDRHQDDNRDAEDIGGILNEYLEINYDRTAQDYPDIFSLDEFTIVKAGAYLMGRDIHRFLKDNHPLRGEIRGILADELVKREESNLIRQILETHRLKYDEAQAALALLESALRDPL
jgi:predicted nucleotidyltransferase